MRFSLRVLAVALGLPLLAGACASLEASLEDWEPVRPWERDVLAREDMAWDPDPLESALRRHVQFSKEASLPGGDAGGGGCGCN